jgi:hypothetical protein
MPTWPAEHCSHHVTTQLLAYVETHCPGRARLPDGSEAAKSSDQTIPMHLRGDSGSVCLVIGCQLIATAATKPIVLAMSSHVGRRSTPRSYMRIMQSTACVTCSKPHRIHKTKASDPRPLVLKFVTSLPVRQDELHIQ